jgi:pimeloyl-ACP methyl ester carboxylesterase
MRLQRLGIAALASLLLPMPGLSQQPPPAPPMPPPAAFAPYASTRDSVRLPDGRDLHFVCMGKGSPTVILTAGLGDDASAWSNIQPSMARISRTCAWDRPGFALSDGSPAKQTVLTTGADLEAALTRGAIKGPYILVGHSLGAFETLLFADRHLKAVAGILLIDPSYPGQTAFLRRTRPSTFEPNQDRRGQSVAFLRKCAAGLRSGAIKPGGSDPESCFAYPPIYPPVFKAALDAKIANPIQYESLASFLENADDGSDLVVNPARNYADIPLIVLTATRMNMWAGITKNQEAEQAAFAVEWNRAHDAYAALSTRGINARVPDAGHYIQRDKPQVVLDALEAVVAAARKPRK